jgi:hypothetical protein
MHGHMNVKYIGMLAYIPLLKWLPEEGTSVPKQVAVYICHKRCTTECVRWMTMSIVRNTRYE